MNRPNLVLNTFIGKLTIFGLFAAMTLTYVVPKTAPIVQAMGEGDSLSKVYSSSDSGDIFTKAVTDDNLGPAVTFSNSAPITTSGGVGAASPYPSIINVSGLSGTLATITVTLNDFSHSQSNDIDILLQAPTGEHLIIWSDIPAFSGSIANQTFTLDDAAASQLPCFLPPAGGTYKPTDNGTDDFSFQCQIFQADSFTAPAPTSGYNSPGPNPAYGPFETLTDVFGGVNPNGNWNLYVFEDAAGAGSLNIAGGWSLDITVNAVAAPTTTTVNSNNNPSFTSGAGSSVTLTANVTSTSTVNEGTVNFTDNGVAIAGCTGVAVVAGNAPCITTFTTEGEHPVVAGYTGTANFATSNSSILTQIANNPTTGMGNEFCNTGNLVINDANVNGGRATPYPSNIFVAGLTGVVTDVDVTLKNVTHSGANTGAGQLDLLLVGPGGQKFILVADAGGNLVDIDDVTITFDDASATTIAESSGGWGAMSSTTTSRPVNYAGGAAEAFPAPAPMAPYLDPGPTPGAGATLASAFNGSNPNGTWALYVLDDSGSGVEGGNIANGWCTTFTTAVAEPTTTVVTSNNNPSFTTAPDDAVTLTATVTSTTTPSEGTVDFTDNGVAIVGCTGVAVTGGTAQCMTTFTTEGEHPITATYNGTFNFGPSNGMMTQIANNHTTIVVNGFCNTGNLTINDNTVNSGRGTPYPSNIFISDLLGTFDSVTVTLKNVTHAGVNNGSSQLDLLLVGPAGQKFIMVSDAGGFDDDVDDVTITFDDASATTLTAGTGGWGPASSTVTSKPINYADAGSDTFPAPAPAGPYSDPGAIPGGGATLNGTFLGGGPNGTWSLYVFDDAGTGGLGGNIAGGWCVNPSLTPISTTTDQVMSSHPFGVGVNNNVTFSADVSATTGTPTGMVEFFADGNSLGSAPLMPGPAPFAAGNTKNDKLSPQAVAHAVLTTSFLFAGNRNITATYSGLLQPGGGGFATSNSNANPFVQIVVGPTAAGVTISGRVISGTTRRGIPRARLFMVDEAGQVRFAMTNPFGFYRFVNVAAGQTYTLTVDAKNRQFKTPTRVFTVADELANVDFISGN